MSPLTPADGAADLQLQAERLHAIAEEVAQHVAVGDLDAAVLVLGVSMSKLAALNESMVSLQRELLERGADYRRAMSNPGS